MTERAQFVIYLRRILTIVFRYHYWSGENVRESCTKTALGGKNMNKQLAYRRCHRRRFSQEWASELTLPVNLSVATGNTGI